MNQYKQQINDGWYACVEQENISDLAPYYTQCDAAACTPTAIPALIKDLFPKADTPMWCYKTFVTDLPIDSKHRIYLYFDRVVCLCEIWVNGIYIGKHNHSEEKFSFDITDALQSEENLLACRVYAPIVGKVGPDGVSMYSVPNYAQVYSYYTVIPMTGIYGTVSLQKKPLCSVSDIYVNPNYETKSISVELTLENRCKNSENPEFECQIYDKGTMIHSAKTAFTVDANHSAVSVIDISMDDVHFWSPDEPYLYDLRISIKTSCGVENIHKRFGFKSFRVEDGWFILNGERIWLSCAHALESKEAVVHAKTMGFKALRYLAAMPSEEILDFCDEVGIMVYEECAVSWGMLDYQDMPQHMSTYLDNMIKRDRNHVSVGIWGIFNEQAGPHDSMRNSKTPETTKVFDFAVSYLPQMRRLDNTRLILLSSGRWDARADIGSYSNPDSNEWNYGWGGEATDSVKLAQKESNPNLDPYITLMGDNHLYPTVPIQNDTRDFVRNIGHNTNPVFLSEYGVGYQLDLHELYNEHIQHSHPDHPSILYYGIQIQKLEEFIDRYSLKHVYPTSRDFLMASIRAAADQRRESIDPVRANPNLCGYSMTSFSVGNEGVYHRNGSFVPGVVDALKDSFAPLKWSIFMDSTQIYANTAFEIEVVLCNEDILLAGEYSAVVSVVGSNGVVFRETHKFTYPQGKPFAASVIRVKIPGLGAGEYTFAVHADGFRQPTCDTRRFHVYDLTELPKLGKAVQIVGDIGQAEKLIRNFGMTVSDNADIVIVGKLDEGTDTKNETLNMAWRGKSVYILDCNFWQNANTTSQKFMQSIEYSSDFKKENTSIFGTCIYVRNWLYHLDGYIADNSIFEGMANIGLLDMDLFRRVYPDHYLIDTERPEKTYSASFGSGLFAKDSCISALTMGEFKFGKGSIVVNTFKLLENIDTDPIADRILYNLLAKN